MITARNDDHWVWCAVCNEPLGRLTERRWWPSGGAWHLVTPAEGPAFFRRTRRRGKKVRAKLEASRGWDWVPGRDEVGRNRLGVNAECPECRTVQLIPG